MAFYSKLLLDGVPFKVLNCEFEFHQALDANHNKPAQKPSGGLLKITVEGQLGDELILAWMLSNTMTKSGTVLFYKDDSPASLKTIAFKTAYCVEYEEEFDHADEENLQISFTITSKSVSISGGTHKNSW